MAARTTTIAEEKLAKVERGKKEILMIAERLEVFGVQKSRLASAACLEQKGYNTFFEKIKNIASSIGNTRWTRGEKTIPTAHRDAGASAHSTRRGTSYDNSTFLEVLRSSRPGISVARRERRDYAIDIGMVVCEIVQVRHW